MSSHQPILELRDGIVWLRCACPFGPRLAYITAKDGEALLTCLGCHELFVVPSAPPAVTHTGPHA